MLDKFMALHAPRVSRSMQSSYTTSIKLLNPFICESNL
jgi:hypothetical protein